MHGNPKSAAGQLLDLAAPTARRLLAYRRAVVLGQPESGLGGCIVLEDVRDRGDDAERDSPLDLGERSGRPAAWRVASAVACSSSWSPSPIPAKACRALSRGPSEALGVLAQILADGEGLPDMVRTTARTASSSATSASASRNVVLISRVSALRVSGLLKRTTATPVSG
jgi:hypothetical protein